MPTSARSNANRQRRAEAGVTLIELLIALSILSMGALIAASAINARLPQRAVHQAAELLVSDLKRARLEAQKTGRVVAVRFSERAYEAEPLNLHRTLPTGVTLRLASDSQQGIAFSSAFAHLGGEVSLHKGTASAQILVHPLTGKIERLD